MQKDIIEDKFIAFEDEGMSHNKNDNWFNPNNLILSFDNGGTTVKMPKTGLFNYSPNVVISKNFVVSMDILMPEGDSFLTFGFNNDQNTFLLYKGWWKTSEFKKLIIKRTDDFIKYYLDGELKGVVELNLDELFFQFRLYSASKSFEFTFKNFQIISLEHDVSSYDYFLDKLENVECKVALLKSSISEYKRV